VPGAGAELAAWFDLAAFANVTAEAGDILVIDVPDVVDAEGAHLAARREASTTPTATAGRTGASATTFAAITRGLGAAEAGTLGPIAAITTAIPAVVAIVGVAALAALSFFSHC
jgi:hypothetical protein